MLLYHNHWQPSKPKIFLLFRDTDKNRQTYRVSIICHKLGAGMAPPGRVHRCQVFDKAGLWVLCHCAYSSITRWVPTARNNIFISNLHPTGFPVIDWWSTYDMCNVVSISLHRIIWKAVVCRRRCPVSWDQLGGCCRVQSSHQQNLPGLETPADMAWSLLQQANGQCFKCWDPVKFLTRS